MGKVDDNKRKKKDAIVNSAFDLFIENGINDTSISDIVKRAGLAKGTFYLYFKDKYEVRDYLVMKKAARIFEKAQQSMQEADVHTLEEKMLFLIDDILNQLNANKLLLRFISKNLSWGIFQNVVHNMPADEHNQSVEQYIQQLFAESDKEFRNPEMMLFMIVELINSTAHNVILYQQPVSLEELKKELYPIIRQTIHHFEVNFDKEGETVLN